MKNKICAYVLGFMFILSVSIPVSFSANAYEALYPRLVDHYDLLTTDEEIDLRGKLDEISETDALFCDINADGKITSSDAREILRASASLVKLPSTEDLLGYKEYQKDEKVQKQIDDLLIILMAYQAAKDEEA